MSNADVILKEDKKIKVLTEGTITYHFTKTLEMTVDEYEQYKDASGDDIADMFFDSHHHVTNNDPTDVEAELELVKEPDCHKCWDIKECQTCCGSGTVRNPKFKYIYAGDDYPDDLPSNTVHIKDLDDNQVKCPDCKGSTNCHHCDDETI